MSALPWTRTICQWGLCLIATLFIHSVAAHKPSDSYLNLDVSGDRVNVQWDIALRDLEHALGVDTNRNGAITWAELKSRHEAIAAHAMARLQISSGSQACTFGASELMVNRHTDGSYAALLFPAQCSRAPDELTINYDLLFELDPLHRGLLRLSRGETTSTAVFSPGANSQTFATDAPVGIWSTFKQYFELGVWHIWIGFDHLLFLAGLLLPVVLRREAGRWIPVHDLRTAAWAALALVTSFTLAHTITLVRAPSIWSACPRAGWKAPSPQHWCSPPSTTSSRW
jgi:hypothetical protein